MSGKVRVIPATLTRFSSKPISAQKKRRVAAYARVSTDEDDQLSSYEAQVGSSAADIRLRGTFERTSNTVIEKVHAVLTPQQHINLLKR